MPIACSNANKTIDVNHAGVNNTYQKACVWMADRDFVAAGAAVGKLFASYGPTVAADAACCQAVLDYSFTIWAGTFGAFSVNNAKCYTSECVASGSNYILNST